MFALIYQLLDYVYRLTPALITIDLILLCECLLGHDGVEFVGAYLSICICVGTLDHLQQLGI